MDTAAPVSLVSLASTVATTPVTSIARMVDSAWTCRGAHNAIAEVVLLANAARSFQSFACVVMEVPVSQIHGIPTSLAVAVHLDTVGRTVRFFLQFLKFPLPAHMWSVNNGQETKYVTRSVKTWNAIGTEATVRCTGKRSGRTAKPLCPVLIYSVMESVTQNVTMLAAFLTALNARNLPRKALADMTNTVQTIMTMAIVTRVVTQKNVAGTVWTALRTLLPNWPTARL